MKLTITITDKELLKLHHSIEEWKSCSLLTETFDQLVLDKARAEFERYLGISPSEEGASALTTTAEPASATTTEPASEPAPKIEEWVYLEQDDVIQAGDEWKLKDGLSHRDGKEVMWRTANGSVGRPVNCFPRSIFRRKVGA